MKIIQDSLFLNVDPERGLVFVFNLNIVSHFSFEAYIGYDSEVCFGINPWHIACIRITIGFPFQHQKDKRTHNGF